MSNTTTASEAVAKKMADRGKILPEHQESFATALDREIERYARRYASRVGQAAVKEAIARNTGFSSN